ncbi:hypothetical protein N657DRAFT_674577 [Parathielavia appendiculata]|uniref:Uncharacterized protein n=1 Tax=Parathielavia appendiculata TaxID=2587402 RepID=A0AAN6TSD8_9PEZI|nr:hypothetical protein N657DRAFT_674577 [Parathielavia appendiculata]
MDFASGSNPHVKQPNLPLSALCNFTISHLLLWRVEAIVNERKRSANKSALLANYHGGYGGLFICQKAVEIAPSWRTEFSEVQDSSVKWIVSSRNWPSIEKDLDNATRKVNLRLELNEESVSAAVTTYVRVKVEVLAKRNKYSNDTRDDVECYLSANAHGTFLWVALVCKQLANASEWEAKELLTTIPPGLDALYRRMMDQIYHSSHANLLQRILAVISVVCQPITLDELPALVDTPNRVPGNDKHLADIVGRCGSFLKLRDRERTISFVHQSAKDFLLKQARDEIFPSGIEDVHRTIFSRSLGVMGITLRRDIYNLGAPGFSIDKVRPPDPDPLAAVRYSCVYWIDHLRDYGGSIDTFLREKYLHWLEALSLQKSLANGVASMLSLEGLFKAGKETSHLINRVRDACRFILYHKWAIENSPLQVYASALVFSPARSITRNQFKNEEPKWIIRKPTMADNWSACLQTLEGHSAFVYSVAWSHDATWLTSASCDKTVQIWDPATGQCVSTLEIGRTLYNLEFHESNRDLLPCHEKVLAYLPPDYRSCFYLLMSLVLLYVYGHARALPASTQSLVLSILQMSMVQLRRGVTIWK